MTRVLIIAGDNETEAELRRNISRHDLTCSFASYDDDIGQTVVREKPDIILYEADRQHPGTSEIILKLKKGQNLPAIALVPETLLERPYFNIDADDFLVSPYDIKELVLRINRALGKTEKDASSERITCDGLTIDLATCEVTVNEALVELTFKEYELLKLLAGNRGRVYTREALLDKIWGYDYYGGDRTVDVHVRRLRSKIEDASHTYIETVRNIGYRFVKDT
jgi:DNA-binding response OmpR family regulator